MRSENSNQLLNTWVNAYYGELYRWAKFKLSDAQLAEDLVQDVFLVASTTLDKFKNESSPRTWLFRILNNKLADHYRHKSSFKVEQMEENRLLELTDSMFDQNANWKPTENSKFWGNPIGSDLESEENLTTCIYTLPELWKKILIEKYYENQNTEKVCHSNSISKANYWQIMHRMKLVLKDCMEKMMKKNL